MTDLESTGAVRVAGASCPASQSDPVDLSVHVGRGCPMSISSRSAAVSYDRPLSELLRERTIPVHKKAEQSGIIADILRRKVDRNGYALLLRNILPAYERLEAELAIRSAHPILGSFAHSSLRRSDRLRSDLERIAGAHWDRSLPLLESGSRYADCIARAASGDGLRLASHAYVRYFGDLSGGQVLKKLLGKSLSLPAEALTLYDFPVRDAQTLKAEMRDALDHAGRIADDPVMLIIEAITAFEHNIVISHDVQRRAGTLSAAHSRHKI